MFFTWQVQPLIDSAIEALAAGSPRASLQVDINLLFFSFLYIFRKYRL